MSILSSFVVGGLVCVVAQICFKIKPNPIIILTVALCLGGLLTAFGLMGKLIEIGGGGVGVMILSCGEALVGTFIGVLAGDASGIIILTALILFASLVLGLGGGMIEHKMHKQ